MTPSDQALMHLTKVGMQALMWQGALLLFSVTPQRSRTVNHYSLNDTRNYTVCSTGAEELYLPFLPILVSLHLKCLGIN